MHFLDLRQKKKKVNGFLRNFLFKGCRPDLKSIDKRFRKQIKVLERSITQLLLLFYCGDNDKAILYKGWRMVKSETRRDAEILVRNPSPRLFGKKFRDSKKVNTNHAKTRLRDLSKTLRRFRDPAKIFRDPRFSRYHSPPLIYVLPVFIVGQR